MVRFQSKLDAFIFAAGLLGLIACILLLFLDLKSPNTPSQKDHIAQVIFSTNDVRIKTPYELAWNQSRPGQGVENDSYIFTGTKSHAVLDLKGKDKLLIKENSLVHLKQEEKVPELKLEKGSIEGHLRNQKIHLPIQHSPIEVNGNVRLEVKENKLYLAGTSDAVIRYQDKSFPVAEYAKKNSDMVIFQPTNAQPITLLQPSKSLFETYPGKPAVVLFQWHGGKSDLPYTLEIFKEGKRVLINEVTGDMHKLKIQQAGEYKWRVSQAHPLNHKEKIEAEEIFIIEKRVLFRPEIQDKDLKIEL